MNIPLRERIAFALSPRRTVERAVNRMRMEVLNDLQQKQIQASASDMRPQRSETRWRGASTILRSLASWVPILGSGRSDTPKRERDRLAARAYDAYRNHMIARAAITRMRTSIVGTGLICNPNVDAQALGITDDQADELNAAIASEWTMYYDNPREVDLESTMDGSGLQSLALISALLPGDCWALTPYKEREGCVYGLKVQLIDGARVSNPNDGPDTSTLQDGVELSADGEPMAIHVRSRHPDDKTYTGTPETWARRSIWGTESGIRRIFQVWADRDRIGTTRGVSFLAPIVEPLQTLEQYSRAELMAAVISAMFTVFIKKTAELTDDKGNPLAPIQGQTVNPSKGEAVGMNLGYGAVLDMGIGEEAQFANPTRPNSNYDPFFMSVVGQIGAALEIPRDVLLMQYNTSYSAARAAMLEGWRMFQMRRWWLVQQFCQPHYQLWFDELVARGRIPGITNYADPKRRAAYTQAVWIGPARGSMDEGQEANAAKTRIESGLSNESIEVPQMTGESWLTVYRQRLRERRRRERDGMVLGPSPGQAAAPGSSGQNPAQPGERQSNPDNPDNPERAPAPEPAETEREPEPEEA